MKKAKTFSQVMQNMDTADVQGTVTSAPEFKCQFDIQKSDNEQQTVFGWANVAVRSNGEQIKDWQEDIIDMSDLESAAYDFVLKYRTGGEMHERADVATLIESMVFTKEKASSLDIPEGTLPEAWWIGFKINDAEVWKKVKDGTYSMFSIEGTAHRIPVTE